MTEQFVALDPVLVTNPTEDSWEDIDLDDYVGSLPSGVTGVALRIYAGSSGNGAVGARKNGSTDNRIGAQVYNSSGMWYVGVDASKIFEVYLGSVSTSPAFWIVGYFIDVTFLTNATDVSLTSYGSWEDIDSGYSTAIGLILETHATSSYWLSGVRKDGSTDARTNSINMHSCGCWVIGAATGVIEAYAEGSGDDLFIMAYITNSTNFIFNTNATDRSLASTGGVYYDLTLESASASANIIEVITSSTRQWNLRRNGDSSDVYYGVSRHIFHIAMADTNGVTEGKISDIIVDFYQVGYCTTPSGGKPYYAYAQQ